MRVVSRRITSSWRGSLPGPASSRARSEGSTSSRRTTRPSALETAFCATTTTSPSSAPPQRRSARRRHRPRGSRAGLGPGGSRSLGDAGDADSGVGLVAPVQVDDHRGQPFERPRARERARVERASSNDLAGQLERELLRRGRRRRRSARPPRAAPRRGSPRRSSGDRRPPVPARAPAPARRARARPGRDARRPSRSESPRDREQRRLAEGVGDHPRGLERGVCLHGQDDESAL